jgi:hypothetical protein
LAERTDRSDQHFDRVITCAGECQKGVFADFAVREFGQETLSRRLMGLTIGSIMVRAGLYLCEQREPLVYYEFLHCVLGRTLIESGLYIPPDAKVARFMIPLEYIHGVGPLEFASGLLDDGAAEPPRVLAWALVHDGLGVCKTLEADCYPKLLAGLLEILDTELTRAEKWPRINLDAC